MEQPNATEMENSEQEKPKRQSAIKFKAFEVIQKNLATVGITPSLVHKTYPFNGSIIYGFLLLGSCACFTCVFIISDAETFVKYTQSVYAGSLATLIIFALLIIIIKVEKLFEFFNNCESTLNISKWKFKH